MRFTYLEHQGCVTVQVAYIIPLDIANTECFCLNYVGPLICESSGVLAVPGNHRYLIALEMVVRALSRL